MTFELMLDGTRKHLAEVVAEFTDSEVKYLGAPSFAYEAGIFTITKQGCLIFDSSKIYSEEVDALAEVLLNNGYVISAAYEESEEEPTDPDPTDTETGEAEEEVERVSIQLPMENVTPTALENVKKLIESKHDLIKKAIGCDSLPVNVTEDNRLEFPWFTRESTPEELQAYMVFVTKLVETAKAQTRVNASQKKVDNEKFAFRCFLLKLGFIGDEYKVARKILLRNFEGSSAFKSGKRNEAQSNV